MGTTVYADLYRHMEWADATVWSAALASEAATADPRLRDLFYHAHLVQRAFLRAWRGHPADQPFPTFDDLPALMAWARTFHDDALPLVSAWTPDVLVEPMPVPWASAVEQIIGRRPAMTTRGETVLQVAMHTHYHRGQINLRLREIGGTPPPVDYIAWLWFGRPVPTWPAVAARGERSKRD